MNDEESNPLQALVILSGILLMLILSTQLITSSFPQNILVNENTVIEFNDNVVTFQNITSEGANITLNNAPHYANTHDIIALNKRNSLTLTGTTTTIATQTYHSAHLTVPTRLNHIALFDQTSLSIPDTSKVITITFKENEIVLTNIVEDTFKLETGLNKYNIVISNSYFTDSNNVGLYRMNHQEDEYIITLIGFYQDKEFAINTITVS
ncbi:MAG: hypothetical protein KAS32_31470 [Candidatus Peribacteraceae bacterium]|nr:hypothetical protein [Candidatus Peribacteraceae bacterium]